MSKSIADTIAATELELYIENSYELVGKPNSRGKAIELNLTRKIKKGTFDLEKSVVLWGYLVEDGAKAYVKKFGGYTRGFNQTFTKATRDVVARRLAEAFWTEYQIQAKESGE